MKVNGRKNWTLFAIFGFACWFFGNLYEAIAFGPNWAIKDPNHLKLLNDFFVNSSPTFYFIPMTHIAAITVWLLSFTNKIAMVYRMASIFAVIVTALTSYIVVSVLSKMFGPGFLENLSQGSYYGSLWNTLNAVRLVLEIITIYYLFNTYRKLNKL